MAKKGREAAEALAQRRREQAYRPSSPKRPHPELEAARRRARESTVPVSSIPSMSARPTARNEAPPRSSNATPAQPQQSTPSTAGSGIPSRRADTRSGPDQIAVSGLVGLVNGQFREEQERQEADQRRVQIEEPPRREQQRREDETRTAGCTSAPTPVGFLIFSRFSISLSGLAQSFLNHFLSSPRVNGNNLPLLPGSCAECSRVCVTIVELQAKGRGTGHMRYLLADGHRQPMESG
jgi:hypothetical protein